MAGGTFGRYRVIEKIATGGMGEVYAAVHEIMQRKAVIKLLQPKMSANQTVVRRFFNEAQATAKILHPGIVEIFDFGYTDDGRAYIVMEMLRGEPLDSRLERQPVLPLDQAVRVIRQLAGAVGAAHVQGIVHRDLKPDNIFLVPDPEVQGGERVKVLDFGLAKLAQAFGDSTVTQDGSVFGTPAYMAPEQCRNAATVDHRADLYSIGCIFYRLVTGRAPFGTGGVEVLAAQLNAPVPLPSKLQPSLPRHIEAVIVKLLDKDPHKRLQSCQELIDTLDGKPGAWAEDTVSLRGSADACAAGSSTVRLRKPAQVVSLPSLATVQMEAVDDDTDRMMAPHLPGVHDRSTVRLDVRHAQAIMQPAAAQDGLPEVSTLKGMGAAAPMAREAASQSSEQTMMLDDHELMELPAPMAAPHPAPAPMAAGAPFARPGSGAPRRHSSISMGMGEVFDVPSIRQRRWWPAAAGVAGFTALGALIAFLLFLPGSADGPEARPAASPPAEPAPQAAPAMPAPQEPAQQQAQSDDTAVPETETKAEAKAKTKAVTAEPALAQKPGASKEPPEDDQPPPDAEHLMRKLKRYAMKSRYRKVLYLCKQTLEATAGADRIQAATVCTIAACKEKKARLARRYSGMLPDARQDLMLQTCLERGVDLRR